jgi:hypothetical protein
MTSNENLPNLAPNIPIKRTTSDVDIDDIPSFSIISKQNVPLFDVVVLLNVVELVTHVTLADD